MEFRPISSTSKNHESIYSSTQVSPDASSSSLSSTPSSTPSTLSTTIPSSTLPLLSSSSSSPSLSFFVPSFQSSSSSSISTLSLVEQQKIHSMQVHAQKISSYLTHWIQTQASNIQKIPLTSSHQQQFFELQTQINKTISILVMATCLGTLSNHIQNRQLNNRFKRNEQLVQALHKETLKLESKVYQIENELNATQLENIQLKHHLNALRMTCEQAILHYREESARQNEQLKRQESAIQQLFRQNSYSKSSFLLWSILIVYFIPKRLWPTFLSKSFILKWSLLSFFFLTYRSGLQFFLKLLFHRNLFSRFPFLLKIKKEDSYEP